MTEVKRSSQLEGVLVKLPMSKPGESERWLKRVFVVKDGFLLYYEDTKAPTSWFDSRPKGVIPMGSSRVSKVSIGSHPHCIRVECSELDRGRELIVACSSERDRNRWYEALELATVVSFEKAMQGAALVKHMEQEILDNRKLAYDAQERAVLAETKVAQMQQDFSTVLEAKTTAERRVAELELSVASSPKSTPVEAAPAQSLLDDLNGKIRALQSEIETLKAANAELSKQLSAVPPPAPVVSSQPDESAWIAKLEGLQSEIHSLKDSLASSQSRNSSLSSELEALKAAPPVLVPAPSPPPPLSPARLTSLSTIAPRDVDTGSPSGNSPEPEPDAKAPVSVRAARAMFEAKKAAAAAAAAAKA